MNRIDQELALLRRYHPDLEYREEGRWVLLPRYPVPGEWTRAEADVCFQIQVAHPGQAPYGFFAPMDLELKSGAAIQRATPSSAEPPFPGQWRKFSWTPPDWRPTADLQSGSNLFNYAATFRHRFEEGA